MPGEPFTSEKNVSAETKANIRKLYGLDQPLWKQYFVYPKNIITEGSFGSPRARETSGRHHRAILPQLPLLGLLALGFAIGIGVPIGVLSAVARNSWVDWTCMAVAMIGIAFLPSPSVLFCKLRRRSRSGPEGGRLGNLRRSSARLYPWPCFRGVLGRHPEAAYSKCCPRISFERLMPRACHRPRSFSSIR